YLNRTLRFMGSYRNGLDAVQAAWAGRKYHGHRTLPPGWKSDLEVSGVGCL
ncbi:hypothetical protein BDM02DRAFT_3103814, partial [Thelephora ganbajun]